MKGEILLIEDDMSISEMVKDYLSKEGFSIVCAFNGEEAVELFLNEPFDLILLDLMLPKLSGMEFLKLVREKSLLPILIISAKDHDTEKALGLGFGADDYISKPFSMIELTARIKAAIRRVKQYSFSENNKESHIVIVNELKVDLDNFTVRKNSEEIKLTSKEFSILKMFVMHRERVYTKKQIYKLVWEQDYFGEENVINVHISRLREKIEDDPSNPKYIKTLWGIGYKLGEF